MLKFFSNPLSHLDSQDCQSSGLTELLLFWKSAEHLFIICPSQSQPEHLFKLTTNQQQLGCHSNTCTIFLLRSVSTCLGPSVAHPSTSRLFSITRTRLFRRFSLLHWLRAPIHPSILLLFLLQSYMQQLCLHSICRFCSSLQIDPMSHFGNVPDITPDIWELSVTAQAERP